MPGPLVRSSDCHGVHSAAILDGALADVRKIGIVDPAIAGTALFS
jgi:hypothetical protein